MILIIDSYFVPAEKICNALYRGRALRPFPGSEDGVVYFVHAECVPDLDRCRHLAEEIAEARDGRVFVINKRRRSIAWYRVEGTGLVREDGPRKTGPAPRRALPHLRAQEDEVVFFPSDED